MQDAPPLRTGAELSVRHRGTGMDVPARSYAPIRHLDRAGERVSGCPCRKTGNHHINREQVKKVKAKTFLTNHRPPWMLTSWPGSQQNHSGSEQRFCSSNRTGCSGSAGTSCREEVLVSGVRPEFRLPPLGPSRTRTRTRPHIFLFIVISTFKPKICFVSKSYFQKSQNIWRLFLSSITETCYNPEILYSYLFNDFRV